MAEYDYVNPTSYDYWGDGGVLSTGTDKHFVWKRTISMATAGDTLVPSTGVLSAADIVNIFDVAEGMMIRSIAVEVTTVEGAACTIDIGDGDDDDGYINAADLNTAGWYWNDGTYGGAYVGDNTPTHWQGRLYAAADTLDITINSANTDVAVIDVWVEGVYFSPIYVA